jgi:hypothetical protein
LRTVGVNNNDMVLPWLMTGNNACRGSPPSEIRQDLWACRGTKAERGYRGETPISLFSFLLVVHIR